ncbi:hypothetical protein [Microbulbifer sp. TYP-18]|uniref:hypothetical protein n=1 Tax=Microbulbifer sp. TYP-18 TaxID=3230024 RepID=UPI0034C68DC9
MRLFKSFTFLIILTTLNNYTLAGPRDEVPVEERYLLTFNYGDSSINRLVLERDDYLNDYWDLNLGFVSDTGILDKPYHEHYEIKKKLSAAIKATIDEAADDSGVDFKRYRFTMTNYIGVELDGTVGGSIIDIRVGGFDFTVKGEVEKYGILEANVHFRTLNKFWLIGSYNTYTGEISNFRVNDDLRFNLDIDVPWYTSLFIDILDVLTLETQNFSSQMENFIDYYEDNINEIILTAIDDLPQPEYSVFGIHEIIDYLPDWVPADIRIELEDKLKSEWENITNFGFLQLWFGYDHYNSIEPKITFNIESPLLTRGRLSLQLYKEVEWDDMCPQCQ